MRYYERADIPFQYALADAFTICDHYHGAMMRPTWPDRTMWMTGTVDPAGMSWQVYQEEDNYSCNAREWFTPFQDAKAGDPLYGKGMQTFPAGKFEYDAIHGTLPTVSWIREPAALVGVNAFPDPTA